jgi:amino acid permease
MAMQLKTKNGHKIRDYYIDLEELLKMYVEYTLYFNHKVTRKITDLEQMMARMEREQDRQRMKKQDLEREQDRETNRRLVESNKRQEEYMRSILEDERPER